MIDRYYQLLPCGCEFDHGQLFPCDDHRKKNPADGQTSTGRGADAVEPGVAPNLGLAREGIKP